MTFSSRVSELSPPWLLKVSVGVAVATITLKGLAWWLTDSVGLLADAMESFVNLAGAGFALLMVTIARRPADAQHPYGHHKAEYFSSGFEGLLIMLAAVGITWTAVERLRVPQPLAQLGWGLGLSVLSSCINGLLAWAMLQSARQHRSLALEGGGRHLLTDVWTSAGVVAGISLVVVTGWLWLDPVVAIAVALNIVWEGGKLVWRSAQGLMDEALEPEVLAQVEKTLEAYRHPSVRFDHLSSRRSGTRRFLDLHMHLPANWTLGRAAAARGAVEQALMNAIPGLRTTIQLLPSDLEAHLDGDGTEQEQEDLP